MEAYNHTEQTLSTTSLTIHEDFEIHTYSWAVVIYRVLVSLFGIPGNILILIVYSKRRSLGGAQVLINALAYSDLYVCLVAPFGIYYFIFEHNYTSAILCKTGTTVENFGWYTSICLTVAVAAERRVAICKPLTRRWSRQKTTVVCALCVAAAVVAVLPDAYGATTTIRVHSYFGYAYHACVPHGDDPRFRLLMTLPRFVSPLVALPLLFVIYFQVWRKVRRQNRAIAASMKANAVSGTVTRPRPTPDETMSSDESPPTHTGPSGGFKEDAPARNPTTTATQLRSDPAEESSTGRGNGAQEKDNATQSERGDQNSLPRTDPTVGKATRLRSGMSRLTRMLLLTTIFFATTWLLTIILFGIKAQTDSNLPPNGLPFIVISVVRLCTLLNHAINPIIYSYNNKQFRRECKMLFCHRE